jgi:hypothetical protein
MTEAPLAVPDACALAAVQRLCEISDPYACGPAVDALFALAMNEITRWHGERSPFYRKLLASRGFKP